jgi:hypothetical protein
MTPSQPPPSRGRGRKLHRLTNAGDGNDAAVVVASLPLKGGGQEGVFFSPTAAADP